MTTLIVLVIYIIGACLAHDRIMAWRMDGIVIKTEDCKNLFLVSMFSWAAFILYGIVKLFNDYEE